MKPREPFGLGAVITDYLWFLVRRGHLVVSLLCLQLLISFVLMVVLGTFDFEKNSSVSVGGLTISVLLPLSMISAYVTSVSRWRQRISIGGRNLLEFRLQGLFLRILFIICALTVTGVIIYAVYTGLRELPKTTRALLALFIGFFVLPIAVGPIYLKDLFPNPWAAIRLCIKGIFRIAPGALVIIILNLLIVFLLFGLWELTIGNYILITVLSVYTPKQEHFLLLQDADGFLLFHTLIYLQLFAAAFLFERFKEITYGRDLRHVADAF